MVSSPGFQPGNRGSCPRDPTKKIMRADNKITWQYSDIKARMVILKTAGCVMDWAHYEFPGWGASQVEMPVSVWEDVDDAIDGIRGLFKTFYEESVDFLDEL